MEWGVSKIIIGWEPCNFAAIFELYFSVSFDVRSDVGIKQANKQKVRAM